MSEGYIKGLCEALQNLLALLYMELRGAKDYTDEGFKEAIIGFVDEMIGGFNGQPEEGKSE